jgi:uncharacterized protein
MMKQVAKIRQVRKGELGRKVGQLIEALEDLESVLVAFSGGVDSSLLLAAAHEVRGENVLAVTASSQTYPRRELDLARAVAQLIGAPLEVIATSELDDPRFTSNPLERCYHCKRELFMKLQAMARERGLDAVIEGSTVEDLSDYRPGEKALRELGVASPLRQADFTKQDVRDLARKIGLPNWGKPAAACLASRFPYGTEITRDLLQKIERLEEILHDLGFEQARARYHGETLRVEVKADKIALAVEPEVRDRIIQAARREGFRYVTLDLQGYRTGSLNP